LGVFEQSSQRRYRALQKSFEDAEQEYKDALEMRGNLLEERTRALTIMCACREGRRDILELCMLLLGDVS